MSGGTTINKMDMNSSNVLHKQRYHFSFNTNGDDLVENTKELKSYIIYSLSDNNSIIVNNEKSILNKDEYLYINNPQSIVVESCKECLLSGSPNSESTETIIEKKDLNTTKVVSKPWGKEYWLKGEGGYFSFKHIILNSGFKTSLQYHELKEETNFIHSGKANLVFKENTSIENDNVTSQDLGETILSSYTSIHIPPNTLHRLISMEDLSFFEACTPELNDVIRIQDDSNRQNGRIEDEHK